ncbi:MAG: hypothetical protein BJ554DRAFT_1526 [Olpidium bornovanus]|uniref:Domain of unknown function at the cortex 1 domain-containing protein n=1 Tax=Olpidium bornovanus TaxID=278681 RepID=A0A8H8A0Y5_9FUNG|nr:MAG: hypothetical protein BJ554DRAFT_1526 [Olpidium bornovanus]
MQLKLRVSAGPTRENQTTLCVNDEAAPLLLRAPHWEGRVLVRVRDFRGVAPPGRPVLPWSPYFDGNSDQYSIQVQGRFLGGGLTADDVIFGNDFDRPLRLPPFSSVGLAVAKTIDPGLQAALFCDKPWAFSPFFVSVNTLNVVKRRREAARFFPFPPSLFFFSPPSPPRPPFRANARARPPPPGGLKSVSDTAPVTFLPNRRTGKA